MSREGMNFLSVLNNETKLALTQEKARLAFVNGESKEAVKDMVAAALCASKKSYSFRLMLQVSSKKSLI